MMVVWVGCNEDDEETELKIGDLDSLVVQIVTSFKEHLRIGEAVTP